MIPSVSMVIKIPANVTESIHKYNAYINTWNTKPINLALEMGIYGYSKDKSAD